MLLAVEAKNLKKTFKTKQGNVEAVRDVSFKVNKGEVFGILGPNGAGKSTTILMLTTLLRITSGTAKINDLDVVKNDSEVRNKIGIALQETGSDNLLTARELFYTTARLWGLSKSKSKDRTEEMLNLVGLTEAADRRVKTYSGGMKRRLDLGLSLVHKPEVLFLDEPTTGLHFDDINYLIKSLFLLIENGHSVIVVEHNLDMIKCADYIIDLGPNAGTEGGELVASGTPEEIVKINKSHTGKFLKNKLI